MADKHIMNMCEGGLFGKIILFALPLCGTFLLQLMFNAADLIVVGRFASHQALAAVGSTGSVLMLMLNLLFGISAGTSVLAANFFGAKDRQNLCKTIHTSMLFSLVSGVVFGVIGFYVARFLLKLMATPDDVLDGATLYMQIIFLGLPFRMTNVFGNSLLRSLGDTKRPLIYLVYAGLANVALNLLMVVKFHKAVEGVAWATVVSELISAVLVWEALAHLDDDIALRFRKLALHGKTMIKLLKIGIPAGIQGSCYSLSNVVIQSTVNSFGSLAMAGNAATVSLEGIIYTGSGSFYHTALSFAGQNYGAKKYDRIVRSVALCLMLSGLITTVLGWTFIFFRQQLLSIYVTDPEVLEYGYERMKVSFVLYAFMGFLDVFSGGLRGVGRSVVNTAITMVCVCGLRLLWIFWILPKHRTFPFLFVSYPLSWGITAAIMGVYFFLVIRKIKAEAAVS
ncbi:MAG: MATE family efflux transporter [Lentisphaeria bacterium]|nr:MATE family efflux transporter [Lentisphaeria bacterium]